ncbi:MAG: leucine-rich repeat domain-containing protein [Oscillospiraceae bacterium]|nr:leucine-rich repeat domain-containing protein [Oscillospiraceae bacterium]
MKKISFIISFAVMMSCLSVPVTAEDLGDEEIVLDRPPIVGYLESSDSNPHPEVSGSGYYIDDGYDLVYDIFGIQELHDARSWNGKIEDDGTVGIEFRDPSDTFYDMRSSAKLTVRIPNTVNGITVSKFYGRGSFTAFDVDPENQYFKSDGQTLFSKDGKTLVSYAGYNESTEYVVLDGTEIIGYDSFFECTNLREVYIPGSVKIIEEDAFRFTDNIERFVFEDFNICINQTAFSYYWSFKKKASLPKAKLVCTKTVKLRTNENTIGWDSVEGASYYEIYQKLNSGEYKLLNTTKGTSCKLSSVKSGGEYTFAVKPVAVISAVKVERDNPLAGRHYPESFTIEGTMSEDIVISV